jgi:hypothetical protein
MHIGIDTVVGLVLGIEWFGKDEKGEGRAIVFHLPFIRIIFEF